MKNITSNLKYEWTLANHSLTLAPISAILSFPDSPTPFICVLSPDHYDLSPLSLIQAISEATVGLEGLNSTYSEETSEETSERNYIINMWQTIRVLYQIMMG